MTTPEKMHRLRTNLKRKLKSQINDLGLSGNWPLKWCMCVYAYAALMYSYSIFNISGKSSERRKRYSTRTSVKTSESNRSEWFSSRTKWKS